MTDESGQQASKAAGRVAARKKGFASWLAGERSPGSERRKEVGNPSKKSILICCCCCCCPHSKSKSKTLEAGGKRSYFVLRQVEAAVTATGGCGGGALDATWQKPVVCACALPPRSIEFNVNELGRRRLVLSRIAAKLSNVATRLRYTTTQTTTTTAAVALSFACSLVKASILCSYSLLFAQSRSIVCATTNLARQQQQQQQQQPRNASLLFCKLHWLPG